MFFSLLIRASVLSELKNIEAWIYFVQILHDKYLPLL